MVALRPWLAAWWAELVLLGALLWGGVWAVHPWVPRNYSGLHQFPFWPDAFVVGMASCALGLVGASLQDPMSRPRRVALRIVAGILALGALAVALPYVWRDLLGAMAGLLLLTLQQALLLLGVAVLAAVNPATRWRLAPLALAGAALVALGTFDTHWPRGEPGDDALLLSIGHVLWAAGFAVWAWPHRRLKVRWNPEPEGAGAH